MSVFAKIDTPNHSRPGIPFYTCASTMFGQFGWDPNCAAVGAAGAGGAAGYQHNGQMQVYQGGQRRRNEEAGT